MLFVLIQQVIEDLLIKQSDALKIVTTPRFEANDLIYKSIGLMGQVGNVLLSLDFLSHISGIITDL